jgi:uncharacterized protein YdbL (DUF1318 family)
MITFKDYLTFLRNFTGETRNILDSIQHSSKSIIEIADSINSDVKNVRSLMLHIDKRLYQRTKNGIYVYKATLTYCESLKHIDRSIKEIDNIIETFKNV